MIYDYYEMEKRMLKQWECYSKSYPTCTPLAFDPDRALKLKNALESISCLCAEGPEFMTKLELTEAIQKVVQEAQK